MTFKVTISTRTALVLLVLAVLAIPATAYATHVFADVSDSNVHAEGIEFMKDSGVSIGCQDGTVYCPDDFVTRAQMGTFMYRLSGNDPATDPSVHAAAALDQFDIAGGDSEITTSSVLVDLPGTSATVSIPEGRTGTVLATFSGESACSGGGAGAWCRIRILVNGTEAFPAGASSDFAFDSSDGGTETPGSWESHAIQRAVEGLPAGDYDVTVQWGGVGGPTFEIDDWQLVAQVLLES